MVTRIVSFLAMLRPMIMAVLLLVIGAKMIGDGITAI